MRPFLFAGVAVSLFGCSAIAAPNQSASDPSPRSSARLRPPLALACDRNHLTSYSGVVSGYRRGKDSTWIEISTDEGTTEAVTVAHRGQADGSANYQLRGQPFASGDRALVEKSAGQVRPAVRAIAWVCDDGTTAPVIDWQPPVTDQP